MASVLTATTDLTYDHVAYITNSEGVTTGSETKTLITFARYRLTPRDGTTLSGLSGGSFTLATPPVSSTLSATGLTHGRASADTSVTSFTSDGTVIYKTKTRIQYVTATGHREDGGEGLPSGDIAGIVVGAVAAVATCIALAFFLLRRRRKRQQEVQVQTDEKREGPANDVTAERSLSVGKPAELHDNPVLFAARSGERYEMPETVSELEGDERYRAERRAQERAASVKKQSVEPKAENAPHMSKRD